MSSPYTITILKDTHGTTEVKTGIEISLLHGTVWKYTQNVLTPKPVLSTSVFIVVN